MHKQKLTLRLSVFWTLLSEEVHFPNFFFISLRILVDGGETNGSKCNCLIYSTQCVPCSECRKNIPMVFENLSSLIKGSAFIPISRWTSGFYIVLVASFCRWYFFENSLLPTIFLSELIPFHVYSISSV